MADEGIVGNDLSGGKDGRIKTFSIFRLVATSGSRAAGPGRGKKKQRRALVTYLRGSVPRSGIQDCLYDVKSEEKARNVLPGLKYVHS